MTVTEHAAINTVEEFLRVLWDRSGTDLLITAGSPPLIRVDGALYPIEGTRVLSEDDTARLVREVLNTRLIKMFEDEREVDFSFGWEGVARFRGNAFRQQGSDALSVRMIPARIPTFDELRLPRIMETFATMPQGLVLVTGPTGSGKSTTLASVIDFINEHRRVHVVTLEDPIEYVHSHKLSAVNQREIGYDSKTFARALKSVLREDPDVVLVGEMRDPETIGITLTVAETGHLVFATLHTNDATQAIDRIIDVFPGDQQSQIRVQLAGCLQAVVSQRLIPRIGGGQVAAFEVLMATNPLRNLIREGKTHQLRNVLVTGAKDGMRTMEASLSELVAEGIIAYEDALAKCLYPKEVKPPPPAPPGAMAAPPPQYAPQ